MTAEPGLLEEADAVGIDQHGVVAVCSTDPADGSDASVVVLDETGGVSVWRVLEVPPLESESVHPESSGSNLRKRE